MDEDLFRDRLSKALKAEVPPDANRGSWIGRRADELNITEDRLGAYLHNENVCPGWILLKLFSHFGAAFEAKVRGTTEAPPLDSAKATAHLKAALEALGVRDDATVIAADFAQRTGLK